METIALKIVKQNGQVMAENSGEGEVRLVFKEEYEKGDKIILEAEKKNCFIILQLDDAIGESLVYVTEGQVVFEVPFDEKKACYSPKSFYGNKHLLVAKVALMEEIYRYRNLACNRYDQHGIKNCFPHAVANVETRGESVFAAKNAINGNCENHSHGEWPYESWGINRSPDARMRLEFGRNVRIHQIWLYIRADFPHDSWWKQVTFDFSDGSKLVQKLDKTDKVQKIQFEEKEVHWLELGNLIKADDDSPFPALSQLEVYGVEVGE